MAAPCRPPSGAFLVTVADVLGAGRRSQSFSARWACAGRLAPAGTGAFRASAGFRLPASACISADGPRPKPLFRPGRPPLRLFSPARIRCFADCRGLGWSDVSELKPQSGRRPGLRSVARTSWVGQCPTSPQLALFGFYPLSGQPHKMNPVPCLELRPLSFCVSRWELLSGAASYLATMGSPIKLVHGGTSRLFAVTACRELLAQVIPPVQQASGRTVEQHVFPLAVQGSAAQSPPHHAGGSPSYCGLFNRVLLPLSQT
ncbi:uncharacterized protein LOC141583953 [Saimiri boliviensis]|uniref:uncharacterized protein LOC141583953 n=1 Tax=Saimiri boliviensis TaxID=27679 RepID=UPI003D7896C6